MTTNKRETDLDARLGKLVESCCKDDRVRYVEINFARQKHDTGRTNGVSSVAVGSCFATVTQYGDRE